MRTGQNIYKRRDGRWEARVFLGKKANGRPNFKYLYASTYREVLLQKNNYEKAISLKNTQILSNALFSDAAYSWLLNSARHWKPSTYIKYKNCLEKYILPQWKKLYVSDIRQGTYAVDGISPTGAFRRFYPDNQYDHQRDFETHIKLSSGQMYRNGF